MKYFVLCKNSLMFSIVYFTLATHYIILNIQMRKKSCKHSILHDSRIEMIKTHMFRTENTVNCVHMFYSDVECNAIHLLKQKV